LTVVLLLFDVDETEPLFDCVTLAVLEFVADAAPLVTVAVDVPVFVPALVFVAVPPVLPAVGVLALPLTLMFPSVACASACCELVFEPFTDDVARLQPEFALAVWFVETDELWSTVRFAPLSLPECFQPSSPPFVVLPEESEATVTPPVFVCDTVAALVLPAVAAPEPADAMLVPLFVPVLPFVAAPPLFPASASDTEADAVMLPPLADASAHCVLSFMPSTVESALLLPEFAFEFCDVSICDDWVMCAEATAPRSPPPSIVAPAAPIPNTEAPPITMQQSLILLFVRTTGDSSMTCSDIADHSRDRRGASHPQGVWKPHLEACSPLGGFSR